MRPSPSSSTPPAVQPYGDWRAKSSIGIGARHGAAFRTRSWERRGLRARGQRHESVSERGLIPDAGRTRSAPGANKDRIIACRIEVHWVWIQYPQSALCRPDVTSILESSVESLASYLTLVHSLIVSLFFTFKHVSEECQDVNVISPKTNAWRTDVDQMWRPFLRAQLKV